MTDRGPVGFGRRPDTSGTGDVVRATVVPEGAVRLDDDAAGALLPERPVRGHKGSFGKLLVIAGSLDYAGAALLVCRAGARTGAGLVTLAVPESLQPLFAAKVVEATTMALPEDDLEEIDAEGSLARILDHEHDSIVVGPGLRPGLSTVDLVHELIAAGDAEAAPIVLDAEALRSLATMDAWWQEMARHGVLTPHAGEFARLRAGMGVAPESDGDLAADDVARVAAAKTAATTWGQVVVLKGAATVIAAPDGSVAIAPFENPALATGGTGDVLAGAIGALLAQGLEPFAAARLGVYLHGLAGDGARERFGDAGVIASDLPEGLALARKRLSAAAERRRARGRLGFGARSGESVSSGEPGTTGDPGTTGRSGNDTRSGDDRRPGHAGRARGRPAVGSGLSRPAATGMASLGAEPSIDERVAAAGLPPLPRTAWLEIDLDALVANLGLMREAAGPGVAVRPVVKADAYGHGAIPVARALVEAGVDGLCVATLDEALALRAARITAPILVLYPIPPAWGPEAARRGIAVSAGDPGLLTALLGSYGSARRPGTRRLRIELEVETGLGRGGFAPEGVVAAAEAVRAGQAVVAGLWTHLQAPEDPEVTKRQQERFEAVAATLRAAGVRLPGRHTAASVGLLTGSDAISGLDGVRPGLAVYGLVPDELSAAQRRSPIVSRLRPVLSLHARPVRVADLPAGWGISYGPTFSTARPSRIATLPLGYGDGWSRSLSNRASALVRGHRVPLVGNVAMDAVMADVTDVPGAPVTTADRFTLIGRQGAESITVAELAQARTTNSWEVVTGMARRLPRVYHARPGPLGLRTLTEWS